MEEQDSDEEENSQKNKEKENVDKGTFEKLKKLQMLIRKESALKQLCKLLYLI
jgi:hypothetical protein